MTPQLKSLITAEDSKVDVGAVDENGCSALVWAARNGHADTVTYLVDECGADVESASYGGLRALHHACNNNHEGIIKLLLEKDASPNAVDDAGNMTLRKLGGLAPSLLRAPLTKTALPRLRGRRRHPQHPRAAPRQGPRHARRQQRRGHAVAQGVHLRAAGVREEAG